MDEHGARGVGAVPFDMLWSCTTCGACVEQCPVDIEHVDHIVDMRRHQVLMEAAFPEAGVMLNNLEHAGDPWGRGSSARMEWAAPLDFEVRQFGANGEETIPEDVEYLYWVGCAGALDDTAMRTARAVATLLHEAGVEFMVLGEAEACTGDPARRMGHEFLFQMLAMQNVETLNTAGAKRIVVTCAHCFNTLANEYPQVGGHYEVVHHTTLLARLVAEGKIARSTASTLQRHTTTRAISAAQPDLHRTARAARGDPRAARHRDGTDQGEVLLLRKAGGARMWMDENLGTGSTSTAPTRRSAPSPTSSPRPRPFCITMLSDGVSQRRSRHRGRDRPGRRCRRDPAPLSVKPEDVPTPVRNPRFTLLLPTRAPPDPLGNRHDCHRHLRYLRPRGRGGPDVQSLDLMLEALQRLSSTPR